MFEMCAFRVPFDAPNLAGLVQKICRGAAPTLPQTSGYSDFTRQLCADMLNRNPSARPNAEEILQKAQIQLVVRKMLDEAQQAGGAPRSGELPAAALGDPPPLAAGPVGAGPAAAPLAAEPPAFRFAKGDLVDYWSATHAEWLPATVLNDDTDGRIVIDLKPNTWITPAQQRGRVRPRAPKAAAARPAPAPPAAPVRAASCEPAPGREMSPARPWDAPGRAGTPASRGASPGRWRSREPSPARQNLSRAGTPLARRPSQEPAARPAAPGMPPRPGQPGAPLPCRPQLAGVGMAVLGA